MRPERLLRIAAGYHLLLGLVFAVFPLDALRSLGLEPPRHWALWYGAILGPVAVGGMLLWAARDARLRPGLLAGAVLWNLLALPLGIFFVLQAGLPRVLLGPAVAAGLWAWLLSGLYSADR